MVTEQVTRSKGYTVPMMADSGAYSLECLVKPNADLDGTVTVWDRTDGSFVRLNGWLWSFEPNEEG